jgi:hypothetical protein
MNRVASRRFPLLRLTNVYVAINELASRGPTTDGGRGGPFEAGENRVPTATSAATLRSIVI